MTTDQAVGLCLLVIIAVLVLFFGWHAWDAYRIRTADRLLRAQWEKQVADIDLPPWDGTDWPETGLVRYLDSTDELPVYQPKHLPDPVPVSQISGPFSILGDDPDVYIAMMRERTDAYISLLSQSLTQEVS